MQLLPFWHPDTKFNIFTFFSENRAGGNTQLHAAVLKRSLSAVKLILKVNSKINIKNFGNEVPLHYAAEFSGDEDNLMINDLLSNEETMKIFSDDQLTPVHIAGYFNQPGAINLFAKKGADLNIKSKTAVKDTPMTLAAALGSFEAVKALVENGADMNIGRADDLTSLMAACIKGKMNIVEYLIEEGVSLSEYDLEIMSENMSRNMFIHIIERSLKASVSNKNTSTVRLLLSTHKFDRSLLNDLMFEAVRKNSIDIVNLLLKEGCSLSIRTIDQCSLVYLAARFNAIDVLKYLIRKGIDVKSKTLLGDTTLHGAAYSSSVEAVNLLLKANVLMNISNSENEMPIHIAARENNLKLNDLLSNEEIINSYDDEGYTPIMYSVKYKVNPEIIKLFIKKGANVNLKAKDNKCDTALHLACKNDDLDAVKILLENNAAPNVKNVKKEFPIHIASTKNSYELNDLLSNNVNLNVYDQNGYTPIMHSVIKNIQLDVIELFIRKGSNINLPSKKKSGNTVLHMACCLGYVDLVKVLLEHNPDLTIRNSSNLTPLMMAEKLKKPEVVKCFTNALSKELPNLVTSERLEKAFLEKDEETVRKILSSGYGNVNKTIGCNLFNCVQYAVSQNLLNILILLEEMGGDLQIRNSNRETLLYVAASCNSFNVLKYLIDKGIDVNEVNIDKNTPLHAAAISQSLESVEFLLKAKALINVRNNANQLPIHIAATKNNIALNDILSTRTNLLLVDKNEMTPLHLAAEANCPDNIKLFIRKGVDVNLLQLPLKNTPLHLACCKNNLEAVEVLIDCKANVNIRNQLCKLTAFQIASTTNNVDVMRILLKPKMNITKIDSRLKSVNPTIPTYFHSIGRGCLSLANAVEILCNMSKIEREYMLNNAIKRDQYDLVELLLSFCDPQDLRIFNIKNVLHQSLKLFSR